MVLPPRQKSDIRPRADALLRREPDRRYADSFVLDRRSCPHSAVPRINQVFVGMVSVRSIQFFRRSTDFVELSTDSVDKWCLTVDKHVCSGISGCTYSGKPALSMWIALGRLWTRCGQIVSRIDTFPHRSEMVDNFSTRRPRRNSQPLDDYWGYPRNPHHYYDNGLYLSF